ncbi:MAG TPA: DUF1295 domain-containing protein [Candidatus Eremiobacteraceae bacterium]|nr:DUF1295 domain-containing protein [Candidatus Eremiobacteraceae bacterium]
MLAQVVHFAVTGALIAGGIMLALWAIHFLIKDAAIVEVGWAAGLAILGGYYAYAAPGYPVRKWAIAAMTGIWGLRLAGYLLFSRVIGRPEEGRYVQLRREWKTNVGLRFLFFYEFQALLDVILSLPFLLACLDTRVPLGIAEECGMGIWFIGICGEALADAQLDAFKKDSDNRGTTFRGGLWKYSRHPNYFFEWLLWIGYAVFAVGSPWGWLGMISPALILYFFLSDTGIPATETQTLRSRGEEYRAYQRTTSPFVPWLPQKETQAKRKR